MIIIEDGEAWILVVVVRVRASAGPAFPVALEFVAPGDRVLVDRVSRDDLFPAHIFGGTHGLIPFLVPAADLAYGLRRGSALPLLDMVLRISS